MKLPIINPDKTCIHIPANQAKLISVLHTLDMHEETKKKITKRLYLGARYNTELVAPKVTVEIHVEAIDVNGE